ncbi:MAG: agmatine deiminase family protein, partial [Pseudomonadota bacterium]
MDVSAFSMPDESHPHRRTWMAFVANDYIWADRQISAVKADLALIANTVADYEPVSMLVSQSDYDEAARLLKLDSSNYRIELHVVKTDDLWLRDTGPTFVRGPGNTVVAIDFNFNGWGNKQTHRHDKKVASTIARYAGAELAKANLVLEGGCFEVDGNGTAIMTKSCILNKNRNPGREQEEIEHELKRLLGLRKIIWLEGIKNRDITDGHIDFYARFVRPGEVLVSRDNDTHSFDYEVTRANIRHLQQASDADGAPLKISILDTPMHFNESFGTQDFAAGYIGYYACNDAIIAQKFGDSDA